MAIQIQGKMYITVSERVQEANKELTGSNKLDITTEVLFQEPVVVKATVVTRKGTFTGISAANPLKSIEKMSPYEIAETSAVGRALGFAGYGLVESIASADEMRKAGILEGDVEKNLDAGLHGELPETRMCLIHYELMTQRISKAGKPYLGHHDGNAKFGICFGTVPKE